MSVLALKPAYLLLSHSTLVFATWKSLFPLLHSISFHLTHRLRCAAMFFFPALCVSHKISSFTIFFSSVFLHSDQKLSLFLELDIADDVNSRLFFFSSSLLALEKFFREEFFFVCNWRKKCEYYEIIDTYGWGGF